MPATVYAGAAKRIITPALDPGSVFLAGFDANRRATGMHDDLYARALALRVTPDEADAGPAATFVLVVCDLIGLLRAETQAIEDAARAAAVERDLELGTLVVACTHTHSGPDTIGLWGPSRLRSGVDRRYLAWLRTQIVEAALEAVAALQPARLRVGRGEMDAWIKNSLQPEITDRELSALQATTEEGETVFALLNLACHPEVMWNDNTLVSADFAGAACRAIEAQAGGTAVFASADIGGMMTPDVPEHSFEIVEQTGGDVAQAAMDALAAGKTLAPPALHIRQREVHIPLENPLFKFALAMRVLPGLGRDEKGRVVTRVSLVDLGEMRLVTIPGELLPASGMDLRQMLGVPFRFLIGLADDELGYLIPYSQFVYPRNPFRPGGHYEETMSLSRYATPLLMEAWAALLREDPKGLNRPQVGDL
jgi:hypothetical protein